MSPYYKTIPLMGLLTCNGLLAEESLINTRVKGELDTADRPFVITPHKVNYILPATFNPKPNMDPYAGEPTNTNYELDKMEAKFQISFKFPIWYNIFGDNGHLFFAYTNQSYWQIYNEEISSPFRETNHEPEVFMLFNNDWKIGGVTNSFWGFGAVHQSNGKAGLLSRSWNRIYGTMIFDAGPLAFSTKVWWRLPEDEKTDINQADGDDNPNIDDYIGNAEFIGVYGLDEHRFTLTVKTNFKDIDRGSAELTWSYPIIGNLRLYTQYFNGYGESLIDYNNHNQRIGIGISLNDIL